MVWISRVWAIAVCLMAAAYAAPANAAWVKAETDRFIVYGAGSEAMVREYAVKLQTFDTILRVFHPSTAARTPDTKVQLYLVRRRDELARIAPKLPPEVAGFYRATNEGVFAVALTDGGLGRDDVLFHEYAHHFMLENFPAAYPAWFVEGFAEYFMTTEIDWKGIRVGNYNEGRVAEVFNTPWVPLEDLLSKTVWQVPRSRGEVFYAQAWLLMHYMRSDPVRAKQLDAAILATSKGEPPVKAFEAATGLTMAQLTAALRRYQTLPVSRFTPAKTAPEVTVTRLPPSADDLLLDNLHLLLAPTGAQDAKLLAKVRRDAAKYPGDRLAETTLARAEFSVGDVAAGDAIMARRLAAEPDDLETLLLAGTGQLMGGLRDKASRETRFRAARPLLAKAYKQDEDDFRPLYAYALARSIEPGFPNENDLNALMVARSLAPAVQELSLRLGVALLARGRREEGVRMLGPLINNPHGGQMAVEAKALVEGKSLAEAEAAGAAAGDEDVPAPSGPAPGAAPAKPS